MYDLRMLKNNLALLHPEYEFLICTSIQEDTLCAIEEMGENIAEEVGIFLGSIKDPIGKIRFVHPTLF